MALRAKLERLEKRAGEHFALLRCSECGEEIRGSGDIALMVLAAQWSREAGQERAPDPIVERVLGHPHDALLEEVLRDLPGLFGA